MLRLNGRKAAQQRGPILLLQVWQNAVSFFRWKGMVDCWCEND